MYQTSHLYPRLDPNAGCTEATCVPSQSIYGYRPSLAATTIFLIIFFLSGCTYVVQGIKSKTWFFSGVMIIGCLSEVLGYVAKYILWGDPFSDNGFKMSLVLLTFAPALYSAGIYYTLKVGTTETIWCINADPEIAYLSHLWSQLQQTEAVLVHMGFHYCRLYQYAIPGNRRRYV